MTIRDIATDTHLSLSTVSKYMNQQKISEKNYKKIAESIQRLGYIPNQAARNLRSKNARTISVLLPDIGDYFWGPLCNSFEITLRSYGYSTMMSAYDKCDISRENHRKELQFLLSKQVAGVMVIPCFGSNVPFLTDLKKHNIALVCIDQVMKDVKADTVTSENRQGAYDATKYLIRCGHADIHVLCGDVKTCTIQERLAGYRLALEEARFPFSPEQIHSGTFSVQTGYDQFKKTMMLKKRPTAILSLGHDIGIGALMAANEMGIRFPRDVSFLTFDDDEIFNSTDPSVTAVVQNLDEMGRRAAELIIRRVTGGCHDAPQIERVKTTLVKRKSVLDRTAGQTEQNGLQPGAL